MKKFKFSLIIMMKISLLCLSFFLLLPSIHAQAMFSDTANIAMGIKLELGKVSLSTRDTKIIDNVNFTEDPVLVASSTLINNGSLTGKLAYKINVTKADGSALSDDELKKTSILINFRTGANEITAISAFLNRNEFIFPEDASSKEVIMELNPKSEMPIEVRYKSAAPTKNEKIKVNVTFRLIQSNAIKANAQLFSDEESLENTVNLVPKVIEEKNYWPEENTFKNTGDGKLSYSLEKMNMVFSEVYDPKDSKVKQIKNLNKAILYIKFPSNVPVTQTVKKLDGTEEIIPSFVFDSITTNNDAIVFEPIKINKEKNGMIITFNLNDKYDSTTTKPIANGYSLNLGIRIRKSGESGDYTGIYEYFSNFAKKLVLSSDISSETNEWDFEYKTIPLSTIENLITIKKLNGTSHWVKKSEFEDIILDKEVVNFEVTGDNSGLVNYSVESKNTFSIKQLAGGNSNNDTLNVKITGDTGNTLVISRTLQLQPSLLKMKSVKIPIAPEETKQQVNSEVKVEESSSNIDSTVPNDQISEELIDKDQQKEIIEVNDSSSAENSTEIKEKITTPTEDVGQSTLEEKTSDDKIND